MGISVAAAPGGCTGALKRAAGTWHQVDAK
jgi:hypothetical protein